MPKLAKLLKDLHRRWFDHTCEEDSFWFLTEAAKIGAELEREKWAQTVDNCDNCAGKNCCRPRDK